ncbi:MAG: DNA polymerase [Candidatus Pelagibacter sp.]|nr:DNA polymerase [Candidatus Pelagibacter sp.]
MTIYRRVIWDIETNGLLKTMDKIHCIGIQCLDTLEYTGFKPDQITEALDIIKNAESNIGHNTIGFDIPAVQKIYPDWKPKGKVIDTLVLSRLFKADLFNDDFTSKTLPEGFQKKLYGSHSLKAWGMRLSDHKIDYSGGFETFNEDMFTYMEQDVRLTTLLYTKLMQDKDFTQKTIDLEHDLAEICYRIGNNGWTFNMQKASKLYGKLSQRRLDLSNELETLFEPWEIKTPFTPKRNDKKRGYEAGVTINKIKTVYFNPNSRKHIAKCLKDKYKWKPEKWTPTGEPKVDENILINLPYPEAKKLAEFFLVQKRIAMLAEGEQAWMRLTDDDGKLRHTIISGSCVSRRASHRSPNLAQVPSTRAVYGKECRELFGVPDGWKLVGSDLSGLELRCLAAVLDDGGDYGKQIMEGDIHTHNMLMAGIDDSDGNGRARSKSFIYSLIFGGGDALIGKIVGGNATAGKKLKNQFNQNVPAFKSLQEELRAAYKKKGFIKSISGSKLYCRSEHRLLSQLLQSSGAIIAMEWLRLMDKRIQDEKLDSKIVAWVHDEVQIACPATEANYVGNNITSRTAEEAGKAYGFVIPIESEFSVGENWATTH